MKQNGKIVKVEVSDEKCRKRKCLRVGHYTHYSAAGMSGCSSWTDENYSCLTRDNFGCPDDKDEGKTK